MVEGPTPGSTGALRLVCFELRAQELALPIGDVRETLTLRPITRVFLTPPCLTGIFSLRGEIVPVLDLSVLLGLPPTTLGDDTRIVVVHRQGTMAAVVVDRLRDLRTIDAGLEPPPTNLPAEVSVLLLGVAATPTGTVRVLDLDAIFGSEMVKALAVLPSEELTPTDEKGTSP